MRSLIPIAAASLALAAGPYAPASAEAGPAGGRDVAASAKGWGSATSLTITAWANGRDGASRRWTLRCAPAAGTLPRAGEACRRLARMERPFAPIPDGTACTQIFGGPQEALVRGTYRGRKVWARFDRRDGCRIARWNRHSFLFPISVGAG